MGASVARRVRWSHIIVDEGHRLKDAQCKLARELATYTSRCRLLLTGERLAGRVRAEAAAPRTSPPNKLAASGPGPSQAPRSAQ